MGSFNALPEEHLIQLVTTVNQSLIKYVRPETEPTKPINENSGPGSTALTRA